PGHYPSRGSLPQDGRKSVHNLPDDGTRGVPEGTLGLQRDRRLERGGGLALDRCQTRTSRPVLMPETRLAARQPLLGCRAASQTPTFSQLPTCTAENGTSELQRL